MYGSGQSLCLPSEQPLLSLFDSFLSVCYWKVLPSIILPHAGQATYNWTTPAHLSHPPRSPLFHSWHSSWRLPATLPSCSLIPGFLPLLPFSLLPQHCPQVMDACLFSPTIILGQQCGFLFHVRARCHSHPLIVLVYSSGRQWGCIRVKWEWWASSLYVGNLGKVWRTFRVCLTPHLVMV